MTTISRLAGLQIKSKYVRSYVSCEKYIRRAKEAGLSLCDYSENRGGRKGFRDIVFQEISKYVSPDYIKNVCEIGPGTGRYLEKVLEINPYILNYYYYETAKDWREWLGENYNCIAREADGISLRQEKSGTIDFCHSHQVFIYLSMYCVLCYIREMIRVSSTNGIILFDYYNENSFNETKSGKLIRKKMNWPVIIPDALILSLLSDHNCEVIKNFGVKCYLGVSQYVLAQKK